VLDEVLAGHSLGELGAGADGGTVVDGDTSGSIQGREISH